MFMHWLQVVSEKSNHKIHHLHMFNLALHLHNMLFNTLIHPRLRCNNVCVNYLMEITVYAFLNLCIFYFLNVVDPFVERQSFSVHYCFLHTFENLPHLNPLSSFLLNTSLLPPQPKIILKGLEGSILHFLCRTRPTLILIHMFLQDVLNRKMG